MKREDIAAMLPRAFEPLALDMERWTAHVQPAKQAALGEREKARAIARAQLAEAFGVEAWLEGYCLTAQGVALVPVFMELGPARYWPWGTAYEEIASGLNKALADPNAKAALLVIDSPGGYVAGVDECAKAVRQASEGAKPVHAYACNMVASAAYWVASATKRVSAPRLAGAGSVGAMMLHMEFSEALKTFGVQATIVRSGARKCEGNPFEKLTEEALAQFQRSVDGSAAQFIASVAAWRGLDPNAIAATQAAYLTAEEALGVRFLDAIEAPAEAIAAVLAAAPPPAMSIAANARPQAAAPSRRAAGSKPRASTQAKENGVTDAEKAKRRDEIAGVIGQDASEEASKAAQYDQIAAIVAAEDPDAEANTEENADGEDAQAKAVAKAVAAERAEDDKALALPEAKGREATVMELRKAGMKAEAIKKTLATLGAAGATPFAQARANAAQKPAGGDHGDDGAPKKSSLVEDAKKKAAGGRG